MRFEISPKHTVINYWFRVSRTFVVSQKIVSGKNRGDITMVGDVDRLTIEKNNFKAIRIK